MNRWKVMSVFVGRKNQYAVTKIAISVWWGKFPWCPWVGGSFRFLSKVNKQNLWQDLTSDFEVHISSRTCFTWGGGGQKRAELHRIIKHRTPELREINITAATIINYLSISIYLYPQRSPQYAKKIRVALLHQSIFSDKIFVEQNCQMSSWGRKFCGQKFLSAEILSDKVYFILDECFFFGRFWSSCQSPDMKRIDYQSTPS